MGFITSGHPIFEAALASTNSKGPADLQWGRIVGIFSHVAPVTARIPPQAGLPHCGGLSRTASCCYRQSPP